MYFHITVEVQVDSRRKHVDSEVLCERPLPARIRAEEQSEHEDGTKLLLGPVRTERSKAP